jgi:microcystin degradation protein MlrC
MSFKVLTAEFMHESNTFSNHKTGLPQFRRETLMLGEEAIKKRGRSNTGLAGALSCAAQFNWDMQHVVSAWSEPAGPVTVEAFEYLVGLIVEAAKAQTFDGILLCLHGAMVAEHSDDGDGEILARLRAVVGPDMPIAVTMDLHANVSERMCELAQILVSYKTYPHIDLKETACHAGDLLQRTMKREIKPRTLRIHLPMLEEANGGRTDVGPMIERIAKARAWEAEQPGAFAVSINGAFPEADIAEVGPTVLVTYEGDDRLHRAFAQSLADDIWNRRGEVINTYHTVDDVAQIARTYPRQNGPLIIADYADNPGAGSYGDATELLRALLAAGVEDACLGPMVDPEVAALLCEKGVDATVTVAVGGKRDPRFGGAPLTVTGRILRVSNGDFVGDGPMIGGLEQSFGPSAVLLVDDIEILVTSTALQMLDLQQFRAFGIDPAKKRVVALKSMQHFRAAFEPIASSVVVCDSGALCTLDYGRLPFSKIPRPIYPLDREMTRPTPSRPGV